MSSPTLICLTPVKNESWILERFLRCAQTWADHIILADQQSTDGTVDIARRFDKVSIINNPHDGLDENARQKLLLSAARRLPVDGPRILLALDADEVLSANWMTSPEWRQLRRAPPGTVLHFQWVNIAPGVERGWLDPDDKPFGFVDDGSPHAGRRIHGPRIPVPDHTSRLSLTDIRILHYQYADWHRMKSKQRWYQCWERLNHPKKRPITIYRQYNFMDADIQRAQPLQSTWLSGYEQLGIDMRSVPIDAHYRWDRQVLDLFAEHGPDYFRKLAIWDVDWADLSRRLDHVTAKRLSDPRSSFERSVHWWLRKTQPNMLNPLVRLIQKSLQVAGW